MVDLAEPDPREVGPEEIEITLQKCDRSLGDLRDAVSDQQLRNKKRQELADAEAAGNERSGIQDQIAEAKAALDAANEKYNQTVRPLSNRLQEITQIQSQVVNHKKNLREGCPDESLTERYGHINFRIQMLDRDRKEAHRKLENSKAQLQTARSRVQPTNDWQEVGKESRGEPREVQLWSERVANNEHALAEIQDQINLLQSEQAELAEAMIEA